MFLHKKLRFFQKGGGEYNKILSEMINKHWSSNTSKFYFIQICQGFITYHVQKLLTAGPLPPLQTVRTA